ncbi:ODV-E56 [Drosophila innubila nudivirus]|uniref:ODV-E56 n=1 Tax=Drosophila innubila nudivirus TaxID=2057187 RepID=A0A2H4UXC4_9VIRU|nr:ODV-E56 [Drosophila innubila nudivirus]ATZ81566.1 ODV-E56 [Drosophila innubila nudivirus]
MALSSFLRDLKGLGRATVSESESVMRGFRSEIKPLEEAITSMPIRKTGAGFIEMGEESVGFVNKIMREGDLAEIIRISEKTIPFTTSESRLFESLVAETPERVYRDVIEDVTKNARNYPHLNIVVNEFPNISRSATQDIAKIESNLFRKLKTGVVLSLTVGSLVVGTGWALRATRQRAGCFMMTTINNKTSSCKVQAYTCDGTPDFLCTGTLPYFNVTLVLMKIADSENNNALKQQIAAAVNIPVDQLKDNLDKVLDQSYNTVYEIINNAKDRPEVNVCAERNPKIEGGIIPPCRMCSPSADPKSTQYIDPNSYPENVTFQCVTNPSILDTITDAALATGADLFEGLNNGLLRTLKPLGIALIAIVILVFLISIILSVIRKKTTESFVDNNNNSIRKPYRL